MKTVISVQPLENHRLLLEFDNGTGAYGVGRSPLDYIQDIQLCKGGRRTL